MRIPNPIRGTLKRKKAWEEHRSKKVVKPKKEKFPAKKKLSVYETAKLNGYKSGLEDTVAAQIAEYYNISIVQVKTELYESVRLKFIQPEKKRGYKPDFPLRNGVIVETKGLIRGKFTAADRQKHLWVREQHPEVDIRFLFKDASKPIHKGAKTTCGEWCEQNGFIYAEKLIPLEWFKE